LCQQNQAIFGVAFGFVSEIHESAFDESAEMRSQEASQRKRILASENSARFVGADVHFECNGCHQPMEVNAEAAGQEFRCPGCGAKLTVPEARRNWSGRSGKMKTLADQSSLSIVFVNLCQHGELG
jgi:Zn finger protein HypA/HybF involved in hydrogenase expression